MSKKHWQDQPRHPAGTSEGGRWAPSGGTSVLEKAMRSGSDTKFVYTRYNNQVADELQRVDHYLGGLPYEHLFITHPETGKNLMDITSKDEWRVSVEGTDAIEFRWAAPNAIVTHNHPNEDGSFSPQDLIVAIKNNVAVMRVVGKNVIHELRANMHSPFNHNSWMAGSPYPNEPFSTMGLTYIQSLYEEVMMGAASVMYQDFYWRDMPKADRSKVMISGMTDMAEFMHWEYSVYEK